MAAIGDVSFTDFVDKSKTAMTCALESLTVTTSEYLVTVELGSSVAFGAVTYR